MSNPLRKEMFRKFDRIDNLLKNCQEHLMDIINPHLNTTTLEQALVLRSEGELTKENHPYAQQLDLLFNEMEALDMMLEVNKEAEEIFRKL